MPKIVSPYHYSKYEFISEHPEEFSIKLIQYAETHIERYKYQLELFDIIEDKKLAINVENSIFEFALSYILNNNLDDSFIKDIYIDKYNSILQNINGNKKINNTTLLLNIKNNTIDPKEIAFLQPYEIHPDRWKNIIDKKNYKELKKLNEDYCTIHKCPQCGESKTKVTQVQIRSADEPVTTFIVCIVCGKTQKLND